MRQNMITKTDKAKNLFSSGKIAEALKIFKTFKIGFSAEEKQTLEIAHECMSGNEKFYASLNIDTEQTKKQAVLIIQQKYF